MVYTIAKYIFTDLELSKLDEKLIQILAWQRLQQLMPSKSASEGQKKATLNGLLTTPGKSDFLFQQSLILLTCIR